VLLRCSSPPKPGFTGDPDSVNSALDLLLHVFPQVLQEMDGKRVVDFGCGTGHQAVAIARQSSAEVVGIDIREDLLEKARRLAAAEGVADRVTFVTRLDPGDTFDWVVSQNSMEHFRDPEAILGLMAGILAPRGRILVTFCPTWLSPYGAHMNFFTMVPWVHLLFPERTVMAVRARFVSDGAMRYEDVTGGLNRMTVRRFDQLVRRSGLQVCYQKLEYVKDLRVLGRFPPTMEYFTNRVTQILSRHC
jgi:SAM-dependent methyltransferase